MPLLRVGNGRLSVRGISACVGRDIGCSVCELPDVAQIPDDLEYFAACRKHTAIFSFVCVHGLHEFDFVAGIVSFAGGRVDLTPTLRFVALLFFSDDGSDLLLVCIQVASASSSTIQCNNLFTRNFSFCHLKTPKSKRSVLFSRQFFPAPRILR